MEIKLVDVEAINKQMSEGVNNGKTYHTDIKGMISHEGKVALATDELVLYPFKDGVVKLTFWQDSTDGHLYPFPAYTVTFTLDEITTVGGRVALKKFMGDRYQYNSRICSNEAGTYRWLGVKQHA